MQRLTGLAAVEAGHGTSTWAMPASPWWLTSTGLFPGGVPAFAADGALAGAIYTTQPRGVAVITSEISISFVRPAMPSSERIVARGSAIHVGRQQGLSEARVEDAAGRLLAHATSRCLLRPLPFDPPPPPSSLPPPEPIDVDGPDPYRRPVEGSAIPQSVWDETPGLTLAERWLAGEIDPPPICRLTGWRLLEASEGAGTCAMAASPWLTTGFGTFYGGAVALLADAAVNVAVTTTLPPRTSFGTLDLKVVFLRPVTPDGRDLVARASVVHRGRTMAVTTATIDDEGGKTVAMATGSALVMEDRAWGGDGADQVP
jgi:uncharacterized protein (TIGR00369 family)